MGAGQLVHVHVHKSNKPRASIFMRAIRRNGRELGHMEGWRVLYNKVFEISLSLSVSLCLSLSLFLSLSLLSLSLCRGGLSAIEESGEGREHGEIKKSSAVC